MTTTAHARAVARDEFDTEPTGTRLDRWFARIVGTPARLRMWTWGAPAIVTIIAAVLRLWNLANPHALVFDETFYVKDAWTLMHNGYESAWPANPDGQFAAGNVNEYSSDPEFVAHPPLGKWFIAAGLAIFGAENSLGWRVSTAVIGILAVVLLMLLAKRMFRSTLIAVIAGFLMAIDGNAIVMSRVSLLDNSVMFVALLGFGCILLDRSWNQRRLAEWMTRRTDSGRGTAWGPTLWWRPWLIVAGLVFGLDAGVKWTGFYFLAFFAVYTVVADLFMRRRARIEFWGTSAVLKQGPATFVLMVPIAVAAYIATWSGWLLTKGGYYRDWVQTTPGAHWSGILSWVPNWAQNLWHYQAEMYGYSINLHVPHPYQSNPLGWLLMLRPTSMYYVGTKFGENGCTAPGGCSAAITDLANPLIWWAAAAAAIYLLYRLIRYRQWRLGLILTGLAAGYLPWMLYINRTIFTFYSIAFAPFLYLGLAVTIGVLVGKPTDATWRRTRGLAITIVFLVLATAVSIFFYPIWTAQQVPFWFWQAHMWLTSWV